MVRQSLKWMSHSICHGQKRNAKNSGKGDGRRFKQAGMRWGVTTAQYLMTLVAKQESGLWESDVVKRTYQILS